MANYIIVNGELKHAALGEEREDHKYVARLKKKNQGNKKQKYRYFYTMAEWRAYLKSKKEKLDKAKAEEDKKRTKKVSKNTTKELTKKMSKHTSDNSKLIDIGKKAVDKYSKQSVKGIALRIPADIFKKAVDTVADTVKQTATKLVNTLTGNKNKETKNESYSTKLPNGKTYNFANKDEYDDYQERLAHQQNESDFMKDVPKISDNTIFTKFEDMDKVNELYDPYSDSRSMNCANCSVAYELRRRGYDVEAKQVEADYNGSGDRIYDYFEDPIYLGINGDGSTVSLTEDFTRSVWSEEGVSEDEAYECWDECTFWSNTQSYNESSIEKAIVSNNPPGSRGFIDVSWKSGGAHSIVYDVDQNGKVTIRDSQTYDEYDLSELASEVDHIRIARTDNLKLKENILDAVVSNEDNDRDWYVDKGYALRYRK